MSSSTATVEGTTTPITNGTNGTNGISNGLEHKLDSIPRRPSSKNENTRTRLFGAAPESPRKVRNSPTIKSSIFNSDVEDSSTCSGSSCSSPTRRSPIESNALLIDAYQNGNTKHRLFGPAFERPRKVRNTPTIKSSIFKSEADQVVDGGSSCKSPTRRSPIENNVRRPCSKNENQNTQNNLFGPAPDTPRKVRVTPTNKSTIFSNGA